MLFWGHFFSAPLQKKYVSLVTVAPRLRRPKKEMCLGLLFLNSAQKDGGMLLDGDLFCSKGGIAIGVTRNPIHLAANFAFVTVVGCVVVRVVRSMERYRYLHKLLGPLG